jgi:hypothetical protein
MTIIKIICKLGRAGQESFISAPFGFHRAKDGVGRREVRRKKTRERVRRGRTGPASEVSFTQLGAPQPPLLLCDLYSLCAL